MGRNLSQERIDEMFAEWSLNRNVSAVARKFKASRKTILKYRAEQHWQDRLSAIQETVQARQDQTLSKRISDNLKMIEVAKDQVMLAIKAGKIGQSTASDLAKLIRAELLLLGEPDLRTEVKEHRPLKFMSTAELRKQVDIMKELDR